MSKTKDIFAKFPVIDLDENYILREQTLDDAESFYKYYADPEVSKYILSYIPVSVEDSREEVKYWMDYFTYKKGVYWGIARKDNNDLIGTIGFTHWFTQYNRAELSYDLAKEYWNQGIMTRAVKKALNFGFEEMGLNRVQCFTIVDNPGSERVLLKNGFLKEGTLRQDRFSKGKYWDINVYGLLKEDYESR